MGGVGLLLMWTREKCSLLIVIGAKGFAAKVWMFKSVDVSGVDALSRVKEVELVSGKWEGMQ